jgi:murein DD-endopeptidase MepM/ murein hydrolase activator NlpD
MQLSTRSLRKILAAFITIAGTTLLSGHLAAAGCSSDWLCIDEIEAGGNIELHAINVSKVPLTYTLRVSTRYLDTDQPKRITETIAANASQKIMVLTRSNPDLKGKYRISVDWTVGNKDARHDDNLVYHLPYQSGTSYRVLQGYGSRFSHTGLEQFAVDFKMDEGTPVHAARGGIVARVEGSHSVGCWKDGCGKYANYIVILHDDETTGEYYHLQQNGVLVELGEYVDAGQKIGLSGNTGHSTMPHLHFGVYRAVSRGREQSIPVRFASADGIIEKPRRGGRYLAVKTQRASRAGYPEIAQDSGEAFVN